VIPGDPNDRRPLSPAEILTSLEELARRFGPPAHRPPQTAEQIAAEDRLESIAEDRAHEARWGHVSESEAAHRQDAYDNWLTREVS